MAEQEVFDQDTQRRLKNRHTAQSFLTRRRLALVSHHSTSSQPSKYLPPHLRPGLETSYWEDSRQATSPKVLRQPRGPPEQLEPGSPPEQHWRRPPFAPPQLEEEQEDTTETCLQAPQQQYRHKEASTIEPNSVTNARFRSTPTTPLPIRPAPRAAYIVTSNKAPSRHTLSSTSNTFPLPLLIVGLNRTLLCRKSPFNQNRPSLRPYLRAFLAYVLGVPGASDMTQQKELWQAWSTAQPPLRGRNVTGSPLPHGSTFWPFTLDEQERSLQSEPAPIPTATYHTMLWSDAKAFNVEAMARRTLTPQQMQHLLRIWARNTLLPDRLAEREAVITKDLEIVWDALKAGGETDSEGERRVKAQYRLVQDHVGALAGKLAETTISPSESPAWPQPAAAGPGNDQRTSASTSYGQHNTLLIDDEPAVCRLQPCNVLTVVEYTPERATTVTTWRTAVREAEEEGRSAPPPPPDMDDVLLQTIGVLSHARWERNVSAWVRSGGLGFFSGIRNPGMQDFAEPLETRSSEDGEEDKATEPRLETPNEQRTQRFWAQEGKRALRVAGIACEIGSSNVLFPRVE